MPSLIDRLLGREEPVAAKAVVGPGAISMEINPPLRSLRNTPQALAKQALDLYHSSEWINTAESLVDDKFATVRWHLEDADGETVAEDDADPVRREIVAFLRKPNPLWPRSRFLGVTCRHMGLPGRAFWYLDALNMSTGVPRAAYLIHPGRMWAAEDRSGNLIGWVMDADRPDGREPVPFTPDEIIQFPLDVPDSGYYGVGKAQSAWRKALLTEHTDNYAAGIFASGGRIPGMVFPSNGAQFGSEDDFRAWVHAVRDATDAGRRMSALRQAVDYVRTAEAPNALELPDLSMMSRDDTLAIWRIPKSQLGMEAKTGLNGGERNKYDEAALWQNAIEPRLTTFAELLQNRILDQHGLTLVLETPNFDDDLPLYEISEKARYTPTTLDERRALLGMDPLDPAVYGDMGTRIFMDNQLSQVFPEPEIPEPLEPFAGGPDSGARTDPETMAETDVAAKAKLHFDKVRTRIEKQYQPRLERAIAEALAQQKAELAAKVAEKAEHILAKPTDVRVWWNEPAEYERLQAAVEPIILQAAADVTRMTSATFFRPTKADSLVERVLDYVRTKVGQRITGINATTRDKVRDLIASNLGASPAELGDIIERSAAFDEYRSELIARTETMLAYNDAAIGTYRDFGVEEVVAIDGDDDAECAARNGGTFTISEASGITDHPNGTLDWVPVVKAKSVKAEVGWTSPAITVPAPIINIPEQPTPVVNVSAPVVRVDTAPFAKALDGLREELAKPRPVPTIKRDEQGRIIGLE